jgi:hypothetical protein
MEVSGQLHSPAALPPGKETPITIGYEDGSAPEPIWMTEENHENSQSVESVTAVRFKFRAVGIQYKIVKANIIIMIWKEIRKCDS